MASEMELTVFVLVQGGEDEVQLLLVLHQVGDELVDVQVARLRGVGLADKPLEKRKSKATIIIGRHEGGQDVGGPFNEAGPTTGTLNGHGTNASSATRNRYG